MGSRWSWNVNGMVRIAPEKPWAFNLAGNVFHRQGYPLPYFVEAAGSDGVDRELSVTDELDAFRLDDLQVVDLRLDKDVALGRDLALTLSLEGFNLLGEGTVLRRELDLLRRGPSGPDFVTATVSPRIYRIGMRLTWR